MLAFYLHILAEIGLHIQWLKNVINCILGQPSSPLVSICVQSFEEVTGLSSTSLVEKEFQVQFSTTVLK